MHKPVKASKPASDDDEGGAGRTRLFPSNPLFAQQPVLGENTRELVWKKVAVNGESVKGVSAELGIDMRRVAAVVRMKQIEKSYLAQVRFPPFSLVHYSPPPLQAVMIHIKNSISH